MKEELGLIERFLNSMFICDLDNFPLEANMDDFVFYSGFGWNKYLQCLNKSLPIDARLIRLTCYKYIAEYCASGFIPSVHNACNMLLKSVFLPKQVSTDWLLNIQKQKMPNNHPPQIVNRYFENYVNCMHGPRLTSVVNECFHSVPRMCKQSKIIATKTIRLYLKDLESMLQSHEDWKVVHLIRDPRGIVVSQRNQFKVLKEADIVQTAVNVCTKMLSDLDSYSKLKVLYPDRLVQIRYEDIAAKPVEQTRELYQKLGKNLHSLSWSFLT